MEGLPKISHKKPIETRQVTGKKTHAYHEIRLTDPNHAENWWSKATFEYVSKPLPHYYLHNLDTDTAERGNRYASVVMEEFEALLESKKIIGILEDHIDKSDPAFGMYERRGWQKLDEHGVYMYNPRPKHYDSDAMEKMINRYV